MYEEQLVIKALNKFSQTIGGFGVLTNEPISNAIKDTGLDAHVFKNVVNNLKEQGLLKASYGSDELSRISLNHNFPK